jgi:hypothetical protein
VRRALLLCLCLLPLCSSCGSTDAGTIQILIGEQTDTFTQTPVPTQIVVTAIDPTTGDTTQLADPAYPVTSIDLGVQSENTVAILEVQGEDANGNVLVSGQSVPVQYDAIAGSTLPIFVQRVGQNANLPNPLADARPEPTLAVLSDRFLIVAAGSDSAVSSTTNIYDFAQFDELSGPPTFPRVPYSMPIMEQPDADPVALLIDPNGATYFDLATDESNDTTPPDSTFAFGDVAGGQSLFIPDQTSGTGYWYVIGGTRTSGTATAAVLEIDMTDTSNTAYPTGNLHWLRLSEPRLGASAAVVGGQIVVGGGSTSGAGLEILALGATDGSPLPYPPDPSTGSGMTVLGQSTSQVLMTGGVLPSGADAGVRLLDITCSGTCMPTTWYSLPEGLVLTLCSAFPLVENQSFLVGSEVTSGLTHTFLLTSAAATEIPTKVTHTNAAAILSPVQSIVLVGGNNEFESFIPAPPSQ